MADETLFGRGRGDRDEPPDVDQVFSRAVERQLEEQRELNRLVQETTERLSALEEGLRSFRDQTATNLTGLRAEMHDQTARLGEEVGQQVQRVAAEVDRLRSTSTDHQVRLVQLAEAAESAISALEARHARLSDQLADVDDRLRSDERPADALVAALDRFEVSLASRLDERFGALSHRLGRLQEALTAEDDTEIDLGEELTEIRARVDAVRDDAQRARREAAEQEAAQRRTDQQKLAERLRDELRHEIVGALRPVLEEQVPSAGAVEEAVGRALARHREQAADEDRAALREDLRDELREELRARLVPLEDVRERMSGIDALHRRLDVLGQLRQRMDALGTGSEELVVELRDDLREELRARLAPLEDVRERMAGLEALHGRLDALDEVPERLTALGAIRDALTPLDGRLVEVSRALETLEGRLGVLEGHVGAQTQAVGSIAEEHGEALRGIAEDVSAVGPELVSQVRRALGRIADDVADLQEQLRLLRAGSTGDEEALAAFRDELSTVIGERLTEVREAAGEHRDAVDDGLRTTRDAVEEGLRATRDAVAEHREAVDEGLRATRDAVAEHRDTVDEGLRVTRDAVAEHRDSVAADLRADRDELEERVGALLEAVEVRLDDVDEALGTSLPQALARQREELAATLSDPLSEATERLAAAREELRAVADELGGLPGALDDHVARGVDRAVTVARNESLAATRRVGEAADRLDELQEGLAGLETSLVAYLEARDARMEEERMQVLRDLVEEFAEGLSRRDRSRLARRLDDVRQKVGSLTGSDDSPSGDHEPGDHASGDRGSAAPAPGETPVEPGSRAGGGPGDEPPGLLAALLGDTGPEPAPGDTAEPAPPWEPGDGTASEDAQTAGDGDGDDTVGDAEEPATTQVEGHRCPECGFVAGNAGGLASHRRTHA